MNNYEFFLERSSVTKQEIYRFTYKRTPHTFITKSDFGSFVCLVLTSQVQENTIRENTISHHPLPTLRLPFRRQESLSVVEVSWVDRSKGCPLQGCTGVMTPSISPYTRNILRTDEWPYFVRVYFSIYLYHVLFPNSIPYLFKDGNVVQCPPNDWTGRTLTKIYETHTHRHLHIIKTFYHDIKGSLRGLSGWGMRMRTLSCVCVCMCCYEICRSFHFIVFNIMLHQGYKTVDRVTRRSRTPSWYRWVPSLRISRLETPI